MSISVGTIVIHVACYICTFLITLGVDVLTAICNRQILDWSMKRRRTIELKL